MKFLLERKIDSKLAMQKFGRCRNTPHKYELIKI